MALADLLRVRWPLVQAPMAGVQGVDLALAVSGAGALGSLPCAMLSEQALHDALRRIQAQAAPVNLNFYCHDPTPADPMREAAWRSRPWPGIFVSSDQVPVLRCRRRRVYRSRTPLPI